MFDLVLNMPFICNANQLTGFYLIPIFAKKVFLGRLLILIPIIPIIHAKKSTLSMTKFASLKKIHTKIIIVKRNLGLNDLGFLYYSAKTCPDLSDLYSLIFQSIYHTSFILPKQEIDETVNFRNFCKLFKNIFAAFFEAYYHPIFKWEKQNEVTGHMENFR